MGLQPNMIEILLYELLYLWLALFFNWTVQNIISAITMKCFFKNKSFLSYYISCMFMACTWPDVVMAGEVGS